MKYILITIAIIFNFSYADANIKHEKSKVLKEYLDSNLTIQSKEEYEKENYKELHSKPTNEEGEITLEDLNMLNSSVKIDKKKYFKDYNLTLSKSYDSAKEIIKDKKFIEFFKKIDKTSKLDFVIYSNSRLYMVFIGGDNMCLWSSIYIAIPNKKDVKLYEVGGFSGNYAPVDAVLPEESNSSDNNKSTTQRDSNNLNKISKIIKAEKLFELGKHSENNFKDQKAKSYFEQSLKILKDLNISNELVADETIHLTSTLYNLKENKLALNILDDFIDKYKSSKSKKIKNLMLRAYLQKVLFYKAQKKYKIAYKELTKYKKQFNPNNIDKSYFYAYKELEARVLYYLGNYEEYKKSLKELAKIGYDKVYVYLYTLELNLILNNNIEKLLQDKKSNIVDENAIYQAIKNIYYIKIGSDKLETITDYKMLRHFDFTKIENWANKIEDKSVKDKILNYIDNLKKKSKNNE